MNPLLGWALALGALVVGWISYGWPGLALAGTVITFWLLLQFNRALRVMRKAGQAPMGHVPSAVMLQARLRPGMTMLQVVTITRSLGLRQDGEAGPAETYRWRDPGGVALAVSFEGGTCRRWTLERPGEESGTTPPPA